MNEVKYVNGVRIFEKHANSPDFVLGSMVLTLEDLQTFFSENPLIKLIK